MEATVGALARRWRATLAWLALIAAGLWNLGGGPPWWDEGWTLSVARNLAELGHYGRLLDGAPVPGGLEAGPTVTLPVAASFWLLGVGLWQGRLFGVICTAGALALLWWLAARLYDRRIAAGAIFVLLLLCMHPQLSPLIQGRQVLGEMPMLLYALGGYACLLRALGGRRLWLLPAVVLWWAASLAKAQFQPFWAISLLAPLALALWWRRRAAVVTLGVALGLGFLAQRPLDWLVQAALGDRRPAPLPVSGLYQVLAVVLQPFNRMFALQVLLLFGLPTLLGLGYGARDIWRRADRLRAAEAPALVRLALWSFAASWLAWFALLSVGVPRYLFPAAVVGALFVAAMLHELTAGYDLRATVDRLAAPLRRRATAGERPALAGSGGAWLATLIVAAALPLTLLAYQRYYLGYDDHAAQRVAAALDARAAPDELIETYESELHFLLHRRYHFPPDQVHVELNRRSLLREATPVDYDPLAANPDYLVVGQFARGNQLYAPALASGAFELLLRDGEYEVYRRVRR